MEWPTPPGKELLRLWCRDSTLFGSDLVIFLSFSFLELVAVLAVTVVGGLVRTEGSRDVHGSLGGCIPILLLAVLDDVESNDKEVILRELIASLGS